MHRFLLTIPTGADQEGGIWGQPLSRIARSLIFPVCICTWSKLSALLLCKAKGGPLLSGYLMACQRDADPGFRLLFIGCYALDLLLQLYLFSPTVVTLRRTGVLPCQIY
jgi:hypothetical protein